MKVIRQLLITWMFVAFLMLQGFGQDVKIQPPPPPKPLPLPKKIIPKSVSDGNSSKPKAEVRKIPTRSGRTITIPGRKPIAQRKSLDWSDFTYNSPEEKAFWDKLPDWSGKIFVREWISNPFIRWPDGFRRNEQGEIIKSNSSEGFNGYVKRGNNGYRTIYQFVDGYAVRSKSWWKDGRKWKELDYKEGKQHGLETEWGGNGQKIAKGNYKNVQKHGLETWWYDNGQIKSETNYKDGKKDGLETVWYDNGQKRLEGKWKNRKNDGLHTEWYKDGQQKQELHYKDGKLSDIKVWLPDGKECPKSKVIDGNGTLITYSLEGKEISRRNIKAGTILIPPRQTLRIPKRSTSSDANSSKSAPFLPPWLVPAAFK